MVSGKSKVYQAALKTVEQSLDVYALVRELLVLRLLVDFAVDGRTQAMAPATVARFNLHRRSQADDQAASSNDPQREDPQDDGANRLESALLADALLNRDPDANERGDPFSENPKSDPEDARYQGDEFSSARQGKLRQDLQGAISNHQLMILAQKGLNANRESNPTDVMRADSLMRHLVITDSLLKATTSKL